MSYFERYKKRTSKRGRTQNEIMTNHAKEELERNFSHIIGCTPVLVNGKTNTEMIIESSTNDLEKKAIVKPSEVVAVGDYFKFNTRLWLVRTINLDSIIPICSLLICNQKMNTRWFNTPIPCHANNTTYGSKGIIDNGSKFMELDAKTKIFIQKNYETDKLYLGYRFILNNRFVYKITEIDNTVYGGIYVITCQMDETYDMDDFENNIAYNKNDAPELSVPSPPPWEEDEEDEEEIIEVVATLNGEDTLRKSKQTIYTLENGFAYNWSIDDDSLATLNLLTTNEVELVAKKKSGWVTLTCEYHEGIMPGASRGQTKTLTKEIMIY